MESFQFWQLKCTEHFQWFGCYQMEKNHYMNPPCFESKPGILWLEDCFKCLLQDRLKWGSSNSSGILYLILLKKKMAYFKGKIYVLLEKLIPELAFKWHLVCSQSISQNLKWQHCLNYLPLLFHFCDVCSSSNNSNERTTLWSHNCTDPAGVCHKFLFCQGSKLCPPSSSAFNSWNDVISIIINVKLHGGWIKYNNGLGRGYVSKLPTCILCTLSLQVASSSLTFG